ncbi:MAG: Hsp20/alpha crystallin family protein [Candidatus Pacearchaeota archaeon]|nr:Hsp20/alpha crystallin family protein [Candidatus Pacearchaeota archaeon]
MFDDFDEELKRMRRLMRPFWAWRFPEFHFEMPEFREFREPLVDMEETENELKLMVELPGISKEDIDIDVTTDTITIKAKKKEAIEEKKKGFYRAERSYKGFYRSMTLPCKVIPEKAEANYKDGILTIVLPKAEKKVATKKIKVK